MTSKRQLDPGIWFVTIHRFQPKTGKHRNQTFTLSGPTSEPFPSTMSLVFGSDQGAVANQFNDLVARNHAVTRIVINSDRLTVDIWTAPTTIRPYVEKLAKDHTEVTKALYAPVTTPDTSWMDDQG